MRRRAALVKLSTATTYKVRNLGDIGDAKCATAGLQPLKHNARFRLDFGIASTNVRAALTEKETLRTESDTIRSQQILPSGNCRSIRQHVVARANYYYARFIF
jgi:hypothetical protein